MEYIYFLASRWSKLLRLIKPGTILGEQKPRCLEANMQQMSHSLQSQVWIHRLEFILRLSLGA